MTSTSARDKTYPFLYHTAEEEETSFINESTPLINPKAKAEAMERNIEEAWGRIREKFPNANRKNSTFTASLDKFNRVVVKFKRLGGKSFPQVIW